MKKIKIDSKSIERDFIQIQSRSMSDPILSDIDFKTKMVTYFYNIVKYQ